MLRYMGCPVSALSTIAYQRNFRGTGSPIKSPTLPPTRKALISYIPRPPRPHLRHPTCLSSNPALVSSKAIHLPNGWPNVCFSAHGDHFPHPLIVGSEGSIVTNYAVVTPSEYVCCAGVVDVERLRCAWLVWSWVRVRPRVIDSTGLVSRSAM